jgi:hypothetical protein
VVALGYQHHVPVADDERLVERAVVGVDPLNGEAPLGPHPVVVGLLKVRFVGERVPVVFVRRVARPVPVRRKDLDDQQPLDLSFGHEDGPHLALHVPRAAPLHLYVPGADYERLHTPLCRGGADRKLQPRRRLHPVARAGRQVERARRAAEGALATPDGPPLRARGDRTGAGDRDQADLLAAGAPLDGLSVRELNHLEAHVLPPGGLRRDPYDAPLHIRRLSALDD